MTTGFTLSRRTAASRASLKIRVQRRLTESQADLAQAFAAFGLAARLQTLEPGQPVRLTL
jgi:hypothetical protein